MAVETRSRVNNITLKGTLSEKIEKMRGFIDVTEYDVEKILIEHIERLEKEVDDLKLELHNHRLNEGDY